MNMKYYIVTIVILFLFGVLLGFGIANRTSIKDVFSTKTDTISVKIDRIVLRTDTLKQTEYIEIPKFIVVSEPVARVEVVDTNTVGDLVAVVDSALKKLDYMQVNWIIADTLVSNMNDSVFVKFNLAKKRFLDAEFALYERQYLHEYKQFEVPKSMQNPQKRTIFQDPAIMGAAGFLIGVGLTAYIVSAVK